MYHDAQRYHVARTDTGRGWTIYDAAGNEVDIALLGPIETTVDWDTTEITCSPSPYADPVKIVEQALALRDLVMPNGDVVIKDIRIVHHEHNDY